jgi:hypothetical protein
MVERMGRLLAAALSALGLAFAFPACGTSSNAPSDRPPDVVDCAPIIVVSNGGPSQCELAHGVCVAGGGKCAPDSFIANCPVGYVVAMVGALACNSSDDRCCTPALDGSADAGFDATIDGDSGDANDVEAHFDAPFG